MELAMERVMRAVDASLTTLYILTSPNMHKRVYLEDVIDRVVLFAKYQLHNTIFPAFDPVYRMDTKRKGKITEILYVLLSTNNWLDKFRYNSKSRIFCSLAVAPHTLQ